VRDAYHDQLDQLTDALVGMSRLAARGVQGATAALVEADLVAAEQVIAGDAALNDMYSWADGLAFRLLAQQQPVASDLRTIVTSLRMASDLERAGDYAVHIAKVCRRRYPAFVLSDAVRDTVREMGDRTASITEKAGEVIRRRDLVLAQQLLDDDDAVDALHRRLLTTLLDERQAFGAEALVDLTLIGRYYERLADHAVAVSQAVGYLVTGEHAALTES
jgi:phosphate transport system protein